MSWEIPGVSLFCSSLCKKQGWFIGPQASPGGLVVRHKRGSQAFEWRGGDLCLLLSICKAKQK